MKLISIYLMLAISLSLYGINPVISKSVSNEKPIIDSVQVIKQFKGIYKAGDYYFGGQPTLEVVNWLKSENISLFINLRTKEENEKFTNTAFNEEMLLQEYGIKYISIPVSYPDSYNPNTLDKFIKALSEHDGKVFIHCASGGRVKSLFMAYLVQEKSYTINEAIEFGKQMKYIFPLENLLGKDIQMTIIE